MSPACLITRRSVVQIHPPLPCNDRDLQNIVSPFNFEFPPLFPPKNFRILGTILLNPENWFIEFAIDRNFGEIFKPKDKDPVWKEDKDRFFREQLLHLEALGKLSSKGSYVLQLRPHDKLPHPFIRKIADSISNDWCY